jgi:hypothetical protein
VLGGQGHEAVLAVGRQDLELFCGARLQVAIMLRGVDGLGAEPPKCEDHPA